MRSEESASPAHFPPLLRVQGSITDLSRRRNAPNCAPGIAVRRNRETAASLTRRRSRQFRQGLALCREDVVAHRRGFALHFLEPLLDHVTDRNHSDQTA